MIEFERLLLEEKPDLVEFLEEIGFTETTISGHYPNIQEKIVGSIANLVTKPALLNEPSYLTGVSTSPASAL